MLPNLKNHKIKLVYNNQQYKYTVLTKSMVYKIRTVLDIKYRYCTVWRLMFSTYLNGHSYAFLLDSFRKTIGPYLLIVKVAGCVYGVYFEESLEVSLNPYGRRSKFIFTIKGDDIEVHPLDLILDQIVCKEEYFSFGYNDKGYKIVIDKTLMKGETRLEEKEELVIEYLEVYCIVE